MGLMKENPRYIVVSLRVSDKEKAALDAVAHLENRTLSQLLREAIVLLQNKVARRHPVRTV